MGRKESDKELREPTDKSVVAELENLERYCKDHNFNKTLKK
jgi:hypothetical protein